MQRSAAAISASLKKVPPFPPIATKLLELLANPGVVANQVADLISSDATFTATLLQRANSAQFGFTSEITSARHAVTLLGLDLTREITLAQATAAYAGSALKTEALRRSWQHTVATAVLAEEIAVACERFTNVAFTAGIMHDIGRLGLLVAFPGEYESVIRDSAERCLDLLDFEQETFGMHHAEAGRMLAERWGLPAEMAVIAGRHHDPSEGSELDLLGIVHVACRLADVLGYDVVKPLAPTSVEEVLEELPAHSRQRLMKTPEQLLARIEKRISEFSSEKAEIQPEEALALLATAAAEREPSAVEDAAEENNAPLPRQEVPVQGGSGTSRTPAIVAVAVSLLAAVAAFAYWLLR
jgi:putative nucleotidyltransferase with HDIG domain